MSYIVGVDLGQARDYTAVTVLDVVRQQEIPQGFIWSVAELREGPVCYHLRHLERVRDERYPAIVKRVRSLVMALKGDRSVDLVVDATGVGRAVVDLFEETGLDPIAVTITAGDAVNQDGHEWRVPKRDLVSVVRVLLETQRLKVAASLELAPVLVDELTSFQMRLTPTGHDSYAAAREGQHDDLVLATALACWWGEQGPGPLMIW